MTALDRVPHRLRACAAIVECTRHPTSARLAAFLRQLADHHEQEQLTDD